MVDSLSKPPGGKCVKVGRSLVEGGRGKISMEMFYSLDEYVLLQKNTHTALMHLVEVEEKSYNQNHQKDEVSCLIKEPLPEALRKLYKETRYDLTKEEKRQHLRKHSSVFQLDGNHLGGLI